MTWHYRLVEGEDGSLAVHEVYLDDSKRVEAWTAEPIEPRGDSVEMVIEVLENMLADVQRTQPLTLAEQRRIEAEFEAERPK